MSHRKALTLEQKIALIKDNQNGHRLSVRKLADKYVISKNSAANILQRHEEFLSDYASNCNKGVKRKIINEREKCDPFSYFTHKNCRYQRLCPFYRNNSFFFEKTQPL